MVTPPMTSGQGFAGFGPALQSWLRKKIKGVDDILEDTAFYAATTGKQETKKNIETRGTVKSGKAGRIETGAMRDAVTSDVRRIGNEHHRAEFGWITHMPEYARYQERGFVHSGGEKVEGMYALSDAAEVTMVRARQEIQRRIREL